ncbi:hypothetical protein M413DRAFT_240643 [Hebeloma cylindrosporum]|uniref:Uncharacterized protein n=1 Tax=Hebeloma cylindrosporum TaxID=76867 RepID=A0A0C2XLU8_HEBCY|nr:hypothetical protein M413DRAFT_240643 [Hebeloma cylindrosporum h7]
MYARAADATATMERPEHEGHPLRVWIITDQTTNLTALVALGEQEPKLWIRESFLPTWARWCFCW